jgi:hypothetical protein
MPAFRLPVLVIDGFAADPLPTARDVPDAAPILPLYVTSPPVLFVLLPIAVTTPVPVVVVDGATPAPPPIIIAFAARRADEDIWVVESKYGMPPLVTVPLTV